MSSNELLPLFPSATHPALPISVQILSTLRNLTAPGRGNDLKPEERAALVGVAALIGCERIQSKDLHESSAQKASSVSPAHFRSALLKSRKILSQTLDTPTPHTSPSKRTSRSSTSTSTSTSTSQTSPSKNVVSPFETPKKKFKFSSGVDISGLVRTPKGLGAGGNEPSVGSPLKFSVTPSTGGKGKGREIEEEGDEGTDKEVEMKTPTKRVKYALRDGVDLEEVVQGMEVVGGSGRKGRRDVGAFFALRPGAGGSIAGIAEGRDVDGPTGWGVDRGEVERRRKVRRVERRKKVERPRRDWTYREKKWGAGGDGTDLKQVFESLPAWFESHGIERSSEETDLSIEKILLAPFDHDTDTR